LAGLALLVGTLALPKTKRNLTVRAHFGLLLLLLTGGLMFFADAGRYLKNQAFLVKMILVALALAWHFTMRHRVWAGRIIALALWSLVALAGRAIADFDL
jgi:hypothetical protein